MWIISCEIASESTNREPIRNRKEIEIPFTVFYLGNSCVTAAKWQADGAHRFTQK